MGGSGRVAREEAGKLLPYNLAVDAIITGGLPQHGPCAQPPTVLGPLWAPLGHRVPHPPRVPSPPACVPIPWYPNLHPSRMQSAPGDIHPFGERAGMLIAVPGV